MKNLKQVQEILRGNFELTYNPHSDIRMYELTHDNILVKTHTDLLEIVMYVITGIDYGENIKGVKLGREKIIKLAIIMVEELTGYLNDKTVATYHNDQRYRFAKPNNSATLFCWFKAYVHGDFYNTGVPNEGLPYLHTAGKIFKEDK